MSEFLLNVEDEEDVMLTEQIQGLLIKNHKQLFMQERSQQYFNDWVNSGVYDLEEDVYSAVEEVMQRVSEGKLVLKSFGYIHSVIMSKFKERTGTPSLDELVGNLNKNLRGNDE